MTILNALAFARIYQIANTKPSPPLLLHCAPRTPLLRSKFSSASETMLRACAVPLPLLLYTAPPKYPVRYEITLSLPASLPASFAPPLLTAA